VTNLRREGACRQRRQVELKKSSIPIPDVQIRERSIVQGAMGSVHARISAQNCIESESAGDVEKGTR
jgi:hypothetical protein